MIQKRAASVAFCPGLSGRPYQSAFLELTRTDPVVNNARITIGQYEPNGVLPFYVVGFENEWRKGICLKFSPWQR